VISIKEIDLLNM